MKIGKLKIVLLILIFFVLLFGGSVYDEIIKKSSTYGENFNDVRKENNLEALNKDWIIDSEINDKFKISWINTKNHMRKTVEYGFLGAEKETNEYYSGGLYTYYSTFDFSPKKTEYYKSMCSGGVNVTTTITKEEYKLDK
ncbi:hypothetical protein [Flavobacterium pectinovorum]|uniref:hypothetical protein n=1 Tax=Flavobacterium pectinovorum TaxID=29533 RepID=UPI001FAE673C|nr:hypothetical protein [Flavobacterium pectinovorum]MCI9844572.1 hypothetical protein [Flavobacterium pectinovorum]